MLTPVAVVVPSGSIVPVIADVVGAPAMITLPLLVKSLEFVSAAVVALAERELLRVVLAVPS